MCFFRYPKNLHYKILQRRGQCLAALGRQAEAEAALKEAVASLDNDVPKMPDNKRESLRRDINALITEVCTECPISWQNYSTKYHWVDGPQCSCC